MRMFFGASALSVVTIGLLGSLLGPSVAEAQLPDTHVLVPLGQDLNPSGVFRAWHEDGYLDPLNPVNPLDPNNDGCVTCHGLGLDDGVATSCYSCHGDYWTYPGMTGYPEDGVIKYPYLANPVPLHPDSHTVRIDDFMPMSEGDSGWAWACWYCHPGYYADGPEKVNFFHAPGHGTPYTSGCDQCHGSNLQNGADGFAVSCRWCHQNQWVEPESVPWPDRIPPDHRNLSTYGAPIEIGSELKGGSAWHRWGWDNPLSIYSNQQGTANDSPDGCTRCHGPNLDDGFAPSCTSCHGPGGMPVSHDQDKGGTMHGAGYEAPFENGCTDCHGPNLSEGPKSSCFTCHAATWADHDFAGRPWVSEEMSYCFVCHIDPDLESGGWLHALSPTTDYSVSTTTLANVGNPTGGSRMCMSCHEGNIAVDDFEGTLSDPPAEFIVGNAAFGKNLKQHHPVSFPFNTETASVHGGLYDPSTAPSYLSPEGTISQDMLDDDGQLQCKACHDHLDNTNGDYLANTGSDLCFTCHQFVAPTPAAHHIPGRDDPWGIVSGTDFNCTMCHGDLLQGDNSTPACVRCHAQWDPTDEDQSSPADPDVPASHHGLDLAGSDPLTECGICHANPVTGRLTGTAFGMNVTPSCGQCHADTWSGPPSSGFSVDAGGPYEDEIGETTTLTATLFLSYEPSEGDTLSASWHFGDGTPPPFPTDITYTSGAWDDDLTISHVFPPGETTGHIVVTNGIDQPVTDTFTVNVVDPNAPVGNRWFVEFGVDDAFFITLTTYSDDGVFTAVKGDGSVAFGIETDGVIFWVDLVFTADSWDVGNAYFGNIDRDAGVINGIVLTTLGAIEPFTATEN